MYNFIEWFPLAPFYHPYAFALPVFVGIFLSVYHYIGRGRPPLNRESPGRDGKEHHECPR